VINQGTLTIQNNSFLIINISLKNIDEFNPTIRANKLEININIPESFSGNLKFFDTVYDNSGVAPEGIDPTNVFEIIDGLCKGSATINCVFNYPTNQQEVWFLAILENASSNLDLDYAATFPYPVALPDSGFWYTYTDPATGYQIGLLKFTADNKIDLNNRAIINQG